MLEKEVFDFGSGFLWSFLFYVGELHWNSEMVQRFQGIRLVLQAGHSQYSSTSNLLTIVKSYLSFNTFCFEVRVVSSKVLRKYHCSIHYLAIPERWIKVHNMFLNILDLVSLKWIQIFPSVIKVALVWRFPWLYFLICTVSDTNFEYLSTPVRFFLIVTLLKNAHFPVPLAT